MSVRLAPALIASLIVLLPLAGPARAQDERAALPIGGLMLPPNAGISLKSHELKLATSGIEATYELVNEGDTDLVAIAAVPLPKLTGTDADFEHDLPNETDPVNFISLAITVDGKKLEPKVEQHASILGLDITARLAADKVPLNPFVAQRARETLEKLPADKRKFYQEYGLASWTGSQPTMVSWDLATSFHWSQAFPARKPVKVAIRYVPIIGTGSLNDTSLAPAGLAALKAHCLDKDTENGIRKALAARKQAAPTESPNLFALRLDYLITSTSRWAGPIRDFRLTIDKPRADSIMSLCFSGKFQKTSPTGFQFSAKDFDPRGDLSILFVNPSTQP